MATILSIYNVPTFIISCTRRDDSRSTIDMQSSCTLKYVLNPPMCFLHQIQVSYVEELTSFSTHLALIDWIHAMFILI